MLKQVQSVEMIRAREAEGPKKAETEWRLWVGLLALGGCESALLHSYGVLGKTAVLLSVGASLFSLAAGWLSEKYVARRGRSIVMFGITFAAFLILVGLSCFRGLVGWCNLLITYWNRNWDAGVRFVGAGGDARDLMLGAVLLSLIQGELVWRMVRRRHPSMLGLYGFAWMVLLLLGGRFCPISFVLFCAAVTGGAVSDGFMRTARAGRIWSLSCLGVFLVGMFLFGENSFQGNASVRDYVVETVHNFRYGKTVLPEGNLEQAGKLWSEEKDSRLLVQSEQAKNLYLKGFSGAVLEDGQWEDLPDSAYGGDNTGMLSWLSSLSFDPQNQPAVYSQLCEEENQPEENSLHIRVEGATRDHFYAPATLSEVPGSIARRKKDVELESRGLRGARLYGEKEYSGTLPSELTVAEDWVLRPSTKEQEDYCRAEEVYRHFVYENYTTVDEGLDSFLQSWFWEDYDSEGDGIYRAVSQVRRRLEEEIHYSAAWDGGERIPENENAIRWFLTTEREGNAVMYASAAVEALRAHGIPARYAEGYYVPAGDFAKEDASGQGVSVTGQDAHAWVEVYFDGIGWLPVDVTPGYYYDAAVLQQMYIHPGSVQKTAALEDGNFGADELTGEDSAQAGSQRGNKIVHNTVLIFLGLLALAVILLTAAHVLAELRHIGGNLWESRWLRRALPEERMGYYANQLMMILGILGLQTELGWNTAETDEKLSQRLPGISSGEYKRVCDLLEKTIYGGMAPEVYEERTVTTFLQRLLQEGGRENVAVRRKLRYRRRMTSAR